MAKVVTVSCWFRKKVIGFAPVGAKPSVLDQLTPGELLHSRGLFFFTSLVDGLECRISKATATSTKETPHACSA